MKTVFSHLIDNCFIILFSLPVKSVKISSARYLFKWTLYIFRIMTLHNGNNSFRVEFRNTHCELKINSVWDIVTNQF